MHLIESFGKVRTTYMWFMHVCITESFKDKEFVQIDHITHKHDHEKQFWIWKTAKYFTKL